MTPEAVLIETMFRVVSKDREDVNFILNPTQRSLDDHLTGRDIIPKARQEGVSTYFLARYTVAAASERNVKAVIISHESESTQRLLTRCQYFIDNIRGPKPEIGRSSANLITFPETDSMVYIGTAGSRKFGRGDTITHCHCSEYAYWPNPKALLGGLLQAVPRSGEVAIESTGNGLGNDYHRRVMRAHNGESEWRCHFFNWLNFPEYAIELSAVERRTVLANLNKEWEEDILINQFGVTPEQLIWRRSKLEECDYDLNFFKQEYPVTLDECFQATGAGIFHKVNYRPTKEWMRQDPHLHTLNPHPIRGHTYVLGADPAGGVGKDNSAMEVFCLDTMEQVAEYANNRIEPDVFGNHAVDLGKLFNNAYLVVESNNHGPVTLNAIRQSDYPSHKIYRMRTPGASYEDKSLMKMGFRTSTRTRPLMIGKLRLMLADELCIHSPALKDELDTFVETETGKMEAQEGTKDDRVIASACAVMGIEQAALFAQPEQSPKSRRAANIDPFSLDGIIEECQGGTEVPIRPQHIKSWEPRL